MGKKRIISSEATFLLIFAVVAVIVGMLLHFYAEFRSNNIVTQNFDGVVVNKFISTEKEYTYNREYNITLEFDINGNKEKADIIVDEDVFNKRDTYGEIIPCSVSYDNIGIVEVKTLDVAMEHSNNKLVFIKIMSKVLLVTAVLSCIVEFIILKEDIKEYKQRKDFLRISKETKN